MSGTGKRTYQTYTDNTAYFSEYDRYQERYRQEPRESDKLIVELIRAGLRSHQTAPAILDIGCSTGNLLALLRRELPEAKLSGCDLSTSSVETCRADPTLQDVEIEVADALSLQGSARYDAVTLNAMAFYFNDREFARLLSAVCRLLRTDGLLVAFDWFTPFQHQQIQMMERSLGHPEGVTYHIRSTALVERMLSDVGFTEAKFRPFELPIDLPFPGTDGEVVSYTQRTATGQRLCFRGAFVQPWYHLVARKASGAAS
ncbi:class I SAM-dependent methyltransferase [Algihabitans albus]|uniref:class I SAM-dependent methyltransferase n=1 Tax=Algihabitans albus TaxID=2164067 RepID=UPI000E5C91F5|nr:class I SAM-dependent methyltransferase [Algihabitans albus]